MKELKRTLKRELKRKLKRGLKKKLKDGKVAHVIFYLFGLGASTGA